MAEHVANAEIFGAHRITRFLPQDEALGAVGGGAPGMQARGLELPSAMVLRRGLGEYGSKATVDELRGYASYLVTGGALGFGRPAVVNSHNVL